MAACGPSSLEGARARGAPKGVQTLEVRLDCNYQGTSGISAKINKCNTYDSLLDLYSQLCSSPYS